MAIPNGYTMLTDAELDRKLLDSFDKGYHMGRKDAIEQERQRTQQLEQQVKDIRTCYVDYINRHMWPVLYIPATSPTVEAHRDLEARVTKLEHLAVNSRTATAALHEFAAGAHQRLDKLEQQATKVPPVFEQKINVLQHQVNCLKTDVVHVATGAQTTSDRVTNLSSRVDRHIANNSVHF